MILLGGVGLLCVAGFLLRPQPVSVGTVPQADATVPSQVFAPDRDPAVSDAREAEPPLGARPVSLQMPSLGIDAPIVPVSTGADGLLGVPPRPDRLGWWQQGAKVGDPVGTVVIDGHVDSAEYGPGAFFDLQSTDVGDRVSVQASRGPVIYTVEAVRTYPKDELPPDVFDRDGIPRLVLLTCGGPFDTSTSSYTENVVVYAVPVTPESAAAPPTPTNGEGAE